MEQLVFKPKYGFQTIFLRRILLRVIPITLAACGTGFAISYITSVDKQASLGTLPYLIPVFGITMAASTYRNAKRQQASWESYRLTISDNLITRTQDSIQELSIYHTEVREIIRSSNGGMVIKGAQKEDLIIVPYFLERQEHLQDALGRICPVTDFKVTTRARLYKFLPLAVLVLMLSFFTIHNKAVTLITGPVLAVFLFYSWRSIRHSKNIEPRIKRASNLVILILAVVLIVMVATILGYR